MDTVLPKVLWLLIAGKFADCVEKIAENYSDTVQLTQQKLRRNENSTNISCSIVIANCES
jgi:hypothetical protein